MLDELSQDFQKPSGSIRRRHVLSQYHEENGLTVQDAVCMLGVADV